jgi:peptide/nickel transport system permease protein
MCGGWVDTIIMRIADVQLTFPVDPDCAADLRRRAGIIAADRARQMAIWVLILAIGLSDWVQYARVVRGATLVEKATRNMCRPPG